MRNKHESFIEYIDLIELEHQLTDNTRLKKIEPIVKGREARYKVSNFQCDRAVEIKKKQDSITNNLQEVVFHMIG